MQTNQPASVPDPRRWLAVAAIMLAAALDMIDTTIVNVALPSIHQKLHADAASLQWTVAGYTLAFALFLITAGRLGDLLGRKKLLIIGIAGFTAASLACGLAQSPGVLVGSRVVQGLAAALLMTQALSIFQVAFAPHERAGVFALFGALTGLGAVLGPLVGGVLMNANLFNLDWRAIFLVNVPVGTLALLGALLWVRESRSTAMVRLDVVGVVLITAALLAVMYPLIKGQELGWPRWTYISMICSIPLLLIFIGYERWKDRRDGSSLVQLSLFKERRFVAGLLVLLTFFGAMAGFFFPFTFYLQAGMGYTPLHAGLTVVPFSLAAMVTSGMSTQLVGKFGRSVLSVGMLLMAGGIAILIFEINRHHTSVSTWELTPGLAVAGLGLGLVIAPVVDVILAGVPQEHAGSGSGLLNTADQLGAAAAVAAIGALFFALLSSQVGAGVDEQAGRLRTELSAVGVSAASVDRIVSELKVCAKDASRAADPTVVPNSCKQIGADPTIPAAAQPVVQREVGIAASNANKATSARAVAKVLWYDVGIVLVGFLATFLLPARPRPHFEPKTEAGREPAAVS